MGQFICIKAVMGLFKREKSFIMLALTPNSGLEENLIVYSQITQIKLNVIKC